VRHGLPDGAVHRVSAIVANASRDGSTGGDPLAYIQRHFEFFLGLSQKFLSKFVFIFIIAGVVLSCLHQSSLGTLMVIAPTKMHPLWYTSISPLLFLLSAIAVGFPMVIFESILASRSFKLKPELDVLSSLAAYIPVTLGAYLLAKIVDITLPQRLALRIEGSVQSFMWLLEMLGGVVAPLVLLSIPRIRNTVKGLFISATLVIILGVASTGSMSSSWPIARSIRRRPISHRSLKSW